MRQKIAGLIVTCVILFCPIFVAAEKNQTYLKVRNDYSFSLKLEVKCGKWLGKRFEYEKTFVFPSGSTTNLNVPKQYDRCQIWPSHKW